MSDNWEKGTCQTQCHWHLWGGSRSVFSLPPRFCHPRLWQCCANGRECPCRRWLEPFRIVCFVWLSRMMMRRSYVEKWVNQLPFAGGVGVTRKELVKKEKSSSMWVKDKDRLGSQESCCCCCCCCSKVLLINWEKKGWWGWASWSRIYPPKGLK